MGVNFDYQDGQTPLDEEEKEGLLITTITTRAELDEFEQLNIQKAIEWSLTRKFKPARILSEEFVKELHRRMFNDTWAWAGKFRASNKNIGVDRFQVSVELKYLLDDTKFWINEAIFPSNEIAIRFKHRIVKIHCFANGNGRHSRLIADILIEHIFNEPVYSWGASNLIKADEARKQYLTAIRKADNGDIGLLMLFARS